ncbi:MAG: cupin domain-containing protein [Xanthomonadales bacterium]|nr:cupin domain-containing protein [Xanthomonadales bacterium]
MSAPLGNLSVEQFLNRYWQKEPCLIRRAFDDFEPLLDGNDLAGLACEEMVESRLVRGSMEKSDWTVGYGPFDDSVFSSLGEENWTLLVQDVEKHYAPLQALMAEFSFIPNWRLDDLMISFAATGGSVGPHTDQYDVFLLQAEGRRRWQIASSFEPELLRDCPLNVLQRFTPEQEWVLEPGDMLYLPPNVAHHGIALEPGMTWSIGSRAPSGADLLQGLGEWLSFSADEGGRYSDPDLRPAKRAGEMDAEALRKLRQLMLARIDESDNVDSFLAAFMSRFRLAHEPAPPPKPIRSKDLHAAIQNGAQLLCNPWTRLTWINTPQGARLFAAGQAFDCSTSLAEILCQRDQPAIEVAMLDKPTLDTLTKLINKGHMLLTSDA